MDAEGASGQPLCSLCSLSLVSAPFSPTLIAGLARGGVLEREHSTERGEGLASRGCCCCFATACTATPYCCHVTRKHLSVVSSFSRLLSTNSGLVSSLHRRLCPSLRPSVLHPTTPSIPHSQPNFPTLTHLSLSPRHAAPLPSPLSMST